MTRGSWLIATHNLGKLAEFQTLFGGGADIVGAASLGISAPEETADTFVENALAKARHGAFHSNLPTIADDSGLVVDALAGLPGVRSARYAGETRQRSEQYRQAAYQHGEHYGPGRPFYLCAGRSR